MSSDYILLVRILRGENLVTKDSDGHSDPYLELKCGKKKFVSSICKKTTNPEWNEVINIPKPSKKDELKVTCWDKDRIGKDFMGQFTVILSGFIDFDSGRVLVEGEKTFKLEPKKAGKGSPELGSVSLEFRMVTKDEFNGMKSLRHKSDQGDGVEMDEAGVRAKLNKWIPQRPEKDQLVKLGIIPNDEDATGGKKSSKRGFGKLPGKASKKTAKRKDEAVSTGPVFGVPLHEVMEGQRDRFPEMRVPWVVKQCVHLMIEDPYTFSETGVFRLSGSKEAVQKAKADLNAGRLPDLPVLSRDDLASLLKDWIRELPDPLFTMALKGEWLEVAALREDDPAYVNGLIQVFLRLPEANRAVWLCLSELLVKIAAAESTTMMGPSNIGIVIGPNVLWEAGPVPMPIMAMSSIVAQMVTHHAEIAEAVGSTATSSNMDKGYISGWRLADVSDWLRSHGWEEYVGTFAENNIDGAALVSLTLSAYLTDLHVQSLGHRKKMSFRVAECVEEERGV